MAPRAIAKHCGILTGPDRLIHAYDGWASSKSRGARSGRAKRLRFSLSGVASEIFTHGNNPSRRRRLRAGRRFGGTFLGFSGAAIGGVIGSTIGTVIDTRIISSLAPDQRIEGARLDSLRVTTATEGAVIPRLYGRMRVGGNIIWATDFREGQYHQPGRRQRRRAEGHDDGIPLLRQLRGGACEGPISGIGRIWADGKALDVPGVTWRWHPRRRGASPRSVHRGHDGRGHAPAYRGTAYVVFEDLNLSAFGNRLPQISFEVFRPLADPDTAERLVTAVNMIPSSGEFIYATEPVKQSTGSGGATVAENLNATPTQPTSWCRWTGCSPWPRLWKASLVVAWFGDDLRAATARSGRASRWPPRPRRPRLGW